jgi:hypothetical protein
LEKPATLGQLDFAAANFLGFLAIDSSDNPIESCGRLRGSGLNPKKAKERSRIEGCRWWVAGMMDARRGKKRPAASLNPAGGVVNFIFRDYVLPGDRMTRNLANATG